MKKTTGICFFAVCLLAAVGGTFLFRKTASEKVPETEQIAEIPTENREEKQPEAAESMNVQEPFRYVLREKDGLLVVYEQDGKTILLETNIAVAHLDETTRASLTDGIYVQSEEELYDLLESYSS